MVIDAEPARFVGVAGEDGEPEEDAGEDHPQQDLGSLGPRDSRQAEQRHPVGDHLERHRRRHPGPGLVVDQPGSIAQLALAVARSRQVPVAYVLGLAMRRAADLYPGEAETNKRDAFIIADAGRTRREQVQWLDAASDELLQRSRAHPPTPGAKAAGCRCPPPNPVATSTLAAAPVATKPTASSRRDTTSPAGQHHFAIPQTNTTPPSSPSSKAAPGPSGTDPAGRSGSGCPFRTATHPSTSGHRPDPCVAHVSILPYRDMGVVDQTLYLQGFLPSMSGGLDSRGGRRRSAGDAGSASPADAGSSGPPVGVPVTAVGAGRHVIEARMWASQTCP